MGFGRFAEEDFREFVKPGIGVVVDPRMLVKANTAFALDLYKALQETEGNLFFSPYSISVALAMTYAGARGETEQQMAQVLHFSPEQKLHPIFFALEAVLKDTQKSGGILLRSANSLYPHNKYPFLETFLTLLKKYYGVEIAAVDYENDLEAARNAINNWVAEKTEAKIKDLLPQRALSALTRLVLVNAIYFKGNWSSQFDRSCTIAAPFWVTSDHVIQVPMMQQTQTFGYHATRGIQILELPYLGDRLSMLILLPCQRDEFIELENTLSSENLADWTRELEQRQVQVSLPRFTINCSFSLEEVLITMGMRDAFDVSKANFSGMDGVENWLSIGAVFHQAFVEVNEEGSEAAAATAVVTGSKGVLTPVFQADHPFIFLIREKLTGSILFLGRCVEPGADV